MKKTIINRLKSMGDIEHISVKVSTTANGTVRIQHGKHHGMDFIFRWYTDHFVGALVYGGEESPALVSLYTPLDAIEFVSAYMALNRIRARQRSTNGRA